MGRINKKCRVARHFLFHYKTQSEIQTEPEVRRVAARGMSLIKGGQQVVLGEEAQVVATNA